SGKMVEGSDTSPTCGVICSGWPSWCVGLHLRGWNLKIVIHKNSLWVSHLASWFPTAIIIDSRMYCLPLVPMEWIIGFQM
ncbi:MAG: hypothetical protein ACK53Y_09260, partial [bacterium]